MFHYFVEGLILGLALGTTCLVTCVPVYVPVLMQKERNLMQTIVAIIALSAGRFLSYAAFGLIVGFVGQKFASSVAFSHHLVAVSYLAVGSYLIYSAIMTGRKEKGFCPTRKYAGLRANPFIVGVVTGISICPSFLGALGRAADAGGAFGGMFLFIGFFIGTTLYVLPFGFLSFLSKNKIFRLVGAVASIVAGVWFLLLGVDKELYIFDDVKLYFEGAYLVDYSKDPLHVVTMVKSVTKEQFDGVNNIQSFKAVENDKQLLAYFSSQPPQGLFFLIVGKAPSPELMNSVIKTKQNVVFAVLKKDEQLPEALRYVGSYLFKARKARGFMFKIPLRGEK